MIQLGRVLGGWVGRVPTTFIQLTGAGSIKLRFLLYTVWKSIMTQSAYLNVFKMAVKMWQRIFDNFILNDSCASKLTNYSQGAHSIISIEIWTKYLHSAVNRKYWLEQNTVEVIFEIAKLLWGKFSELKRSVLM